MIGQLDFLCQWQLAADASDRFSAGEAITFLETSDLSLLISRDDDRPVDSLFDTGFEQERHIVDDDRFWVLSRRLPREPLLLTCDAGMNDVFKATAFAWPAEYNGAEYVAIEGAVGIQDGLTEFVDDFSPGRFAGFDDVMGQFVGVNDDRAAMLEHLGDGALAGGDTACEADQNHGCGA